MFYCERLDRKQQLSWWHCDVTLPSWCKFHAKAVTSVLMWSKLCSVEPSSRFIMFSPQMKKPKLQLIQGATRAVEAAPFSLCVNCASSCWRPAQSHGGISVTYSEITCLAHDLVCRARTPRDHDVMMSHELRVFYFGGTVLLLYW